MFYYAVLLTLAACTSTSCGPPPTFITRQGVAVWDETKDKRVKKSDVETIIDDAIWVYGNSKKVRREISVLLVWFKDVPIKSGKTHVYGTYNGDVINVYYFHSCNARNSLTHELFHAIQERVAGQNRDYEHSNEAFWGPTGYVARAKAKSKEKLCVE